MDEQPPLPAIRASDSEREATAETLREAMTVGRITPDELEERLTATYQARTRLELEALIADVSSGASSLPGAAAFAAPDRSTVARVVPGEGGERAVISIMGGHARNGRWRVAPNLRVLNIMGGSELDFNDAELSAQVIEVNVLSIMGGSEIRVPDGVDVRVSNLGIMGGNEIKLGDQPIAPGVPQIHLRLVSIMGGCSVRRGRRTDARDERRQRQLDRRAEREQRRLDR